MRFRFVAGRVVTAACIALALAACKQRQPAEQVADTSPAAPAPPAPPPFVDCTPEEASGVEHGIAAWVQSHDTCVANRSPIRVNVTACRRKTDTGYLEARGTANYSDTFLENTYYSMEVDGQFSPIGSPQNGTINANPNSAWIDACKFKGFIEGISKSDNK